MFNVLIKTILLQYIEHDFCPCYLFIQTPLGQTLNYCQCTVYCERAVYLSVVT